MWPAGRLSNSSAQRGFSPEPQQAAGSDRGTLILIQTFADLSPLIYHTGPQSFLELAPVIAERLQGMSYRILKHLGDFVWPFVDVPVQAATEGGTSPATLQPLSTLMSVPIWPISTKPETPNFFMPNSQA